MKLLTDSEEDIRLAAAALKEGKLVAFPTETVYGLGANAFDPLALARVFEAKRRPAFDPLIIHIASIEGLDRIADLEALSPMARKKTLAAAAALWPGPLTLILPKQDAVPELATSGLPTVAVRLPSHPVARRLIELSTGAVAGPSANPFGYLSPTKASHVAAQLGDRVDFILDGGQSSVGVESTVLEMTADPPRILRPGGTERSRIESAIGAVELFDRTVATPTSPGQLPSHYAPRLPLLLHERGALRALQPKRDEAALFFDGAPRGEGQSSSAWGAIRVLSEKGDPVEAAAALFACLHELDATGLKRIHAEKAPEDGLGHAINDRLYKASEK